VGTHRFGRIARTVRNGPAFDDRRHVRHDASTVNST
jgi:hypothetical protein